MNTLLPFGTSLQWPFRELQCLVLDSCSKHSLTSLQMFSPSVDEKKMLESICHRWLGVWICPILDGCEWIWSEIPFLFSGEAVPWKPWWESLPHHCCTIGCIDAVSLPEWMNICLLSGVKAKSPDGLQLFWKQLLLQQRIWRVSFTALRDTRITSFLPQMFHTHQFGSEWLWNV